MPDDPGTPAAHWDEPPALAVRSLDARPRFGERGLRVPEPVVDRNDVRAVVRGEHLGPDEVVADEAAGDGVPVCGAPAVHVNVRLDREPRPWVEAVGEVRADGYRGYRGLVSEPRRIRREIAPVQLWVLAAQPDELDVAEAEAHGVDAHEQLIGPWPPHVDPLGPPVAADAFDALAVDVPRERAVRNVRRHAVIVHVGLVDRGHFGRGRSAFFSTRPVGSMIPTFVPIVSGLAVKRSPRFITTQRYPGSGASRFIAGPMSAPVAATLICPCGATTSASPSGSGVAFSESVIALRIASRSRRATSHLGAAREDRGDGIGRAPGVAPTSHDTHLVADRGSKSKERGDAACVRTLSIRLDGELGRERPRSIDDDRGGSSVESRRIGDPDFERDLVAPWRMAVRCGSVVVRSGEGAMDLRRIAGAPEPSAELLVTEDGPEPRENTEMLLRGRRKTDDQVRTPLPPEDPFSELGDGEAGPEDERLRFVRPVRQCDAVAEVRRDDLLALSHLRDIAVGRASFGNEDRAHEIDRRVAIGRLRAHHDGGLREHVGRHDDCPASAPIGSPATKLRRSCSEAVLFMKLRNVRTTAVGATFRARSANPSCATTTSVSAGISLTGE